MKWSREATLGVGLVALLLAAAILEPKFVALRTQSLLATHSWELAIVAIPMLVMIVAGGIDLSVGSIVALVAVSIGLVFERGINPFLGAAIGVGVGVLLGAVNGWFVTRTKMHPLLVTLATMAAYRGIAEGISLGRPLSGYPDAFLRISQGWIPAVVFCALAVCAHLFLTRTVAGRWTIAIGQQENVARFSKVPVERIKVWLFVLMGLAAGMAATILVARNNTAKADQGMGMELEAITAVVLGGASIEGGKGRVLGLVLGLVLIHETREFVSWHWKQSELNLIVIGLLLLATVWIDRLAASRKVRSQSAAPIAQNG